MDQRQVERQQIDGSKKTSIRASICSDILLRGRTVDENRSRIHSFFAPRTSRADA